MIYEIEWRDIPGFEGRYRVSNTGEVVSVITGRNLKPGLAHGYLNVSLCSGRGKPQQALVHRLVLIAFSTNTHGKRTVNHLNGDRADNRLSNLEWATDSENHQHAYRVLGRKAHLATLRNSSRPCVALKNGIVQATFPSAEAAAQHYTIRQRGVSRACRGERATYQGFEWAYL